MSEATRSPDQARRMTEDEYNAWKASNAAKLKEARGLRSSTRQPSIVSRLRRLALVATVVGAGGAFITTLSGNSNPSHNESSPAAASEGPSDEDKRLSVNRILVNTEKPDYVQGRKLIIDFSKINGARDGAYVDNGSDSHPGNLVPSDMIEEVNGVPLKPGEEYELTNAFIVTGAGNTGISDTSPYAELMVKAKGESLPSTRFVSLDNTSPGVHYDNKSTGESLQVKSIQSNEIITTSGPINLSDVNVTISRPAPSPTTSLTP